MISFAIKLILKDFKKNLLLVSIFIFIVFLSSSILLISNSLNKITQIEILNQPDIIIFNQKAGRNIPIEIDKKYPIAKIYGVSNIYERVYGFYRYEPILSEFMIIGIEIFEPKFSKEIEKYFHDINLEKFLEKPSMIVGAGIRDLLFFTDSYNFYLENGENLKLYIHSTIDNILSDRAVITSTDYAKSILGYSQTEASDIAIDVANYDEIDTIVTKIRELYPNYLVIKKDDLQNSFKDLYSFKSGIMFGVLLILISTFILLTIFKSGSVDLNDKKEIAILKAIGWSINDILKLKFLEAFIISLVSYLSGFSLSIIYLKYLKAKYLVDIFTNTINSKVKYELFIDSSIFISLLFIFMFSFIVANVLSAYKISTTNIKELI